MIDVKAGTNHFQMATTQSIGSSMAYLSLLGASCISRLSGEQCSTSMPAFSTQLHHADPPKVDTDCIEDRHVMSSVDNFYVSTYFHIYATIL